jgi:hypothetical protein
MTTNEVFQTIVVLSIFIIVPIFVILVKRLLVHFYKLEFGVYKKEKCIAEMQMQKLRNPNWLRFEAHLKRELPIQFKEFYKIVSSKKIPMFNKDDEEYMLEALDELTDEDRNIAIAWNECGEPLYFKEGAEEANTLYVDLGGDEEVFIEDVSKILEVIRC